MTHVLLALDGSLEAMSAARVGLQLVGGADRVEYVHMTQHVHDWVWPDLPVAANVKRTAIPGQDPAGRLAEYAESLEHPLLVVGPHRRTAWERWSLGSVTDGLVHLTTAPLLVVPPDVVRLGDEPGDLRVLVALDGAAESEAALEAVCETLTSVRPQLRLSRVVSPPGHDASVIPFALEMEMLKAREYLDRQCASLRQKGYEVTSSVAVGFPADVLQQEMKEFQANMIACTTHGAGAPGHHEPGATFGVLYHRLLVPMFIVPGVARRTRSAPRR